MADENFRIAARRRLGLSPIPESEATSTTCQNVRRSDGTKCNAPLDREGHHACTCSIGGALDRRHNALRDRLATRLAADLQLATRTEQRCPQWDTVREDGKLIEARLDIVVALGNTTYYIDVTVVDVLSTDLALERQRAKRPGIAAQTAEDKKLVKYPGPTTVPFAVESYGTIGTAGMAWLRFAYQAKPHALQALLNEISALTQSHSSSMIMAASAAPHRGR